MSWKESEFTMEDGTTCRVREYVPPPPTPEEAAAQAERAKADVALRAREPALHETYLAAARNSDAQLQAGVRHELNSLYSAAYAGNNGWLLAMLTVQGWDHDLEAERMEAAGHVVERCPGCSCPGNYVSHDDGLSCVRICYACRGLFGVVTPAVMSLFVDDRWARGHRPCQRQYVDFRVLDEGGASHRVHGYVNSRTRKWVQQG